MQRLETINFSDSLLQEEKAKKYLSSVSEKKAANRAGLRALVPFGDTVGILKGGVGGRKYHYINAVGGGLGAGIGMAGGALGGAAVGAGLGTLVAPGPGTLVGAGLGAQVGQLAGGVAGMYAGASHAARLQHKDNAKSIAGKVNKSKQSKKK